MCFDDYEGSPVPRLDIHERFQAAGQRVAGAWGKGRLLFGLCPGTGRRLNRVADASVGCDQT